MDAEPATPGRRPRPEPVGEILSGGVANAGLVVRVGSFVLRPSNPSTELVHRLLRHVRAAGFDGVPEPVGIDPDGRERLVFIDGDVPQAPFPEWSLSDEALASTSALLARYHRAAAGFAVPPGMAFSDELADRHPGTVVCHNDVCPENVVFRGGEAVALLDFDYAAPGRPLYDLAQLAKMWLPLDTPKDAAVLGRGGLDPFRRLRVVADAYGLTPARRHEFMAALTDAVAWGGFFIRRHVERGEPAFVAMWEFIGGQARFDRRIDWLEANRRRFLDALA